MKRFDPHSLRQRQERYKEDYQRGYCLHEHTDEQEQQIDNQYYHELVVSDRQYTRGDRLRDALRDQNPAEDIGKADEHQNSSRGNRAVD